MRTGTYRFVTSLISTGMARAALTICISASTKAQMLGPTKNNVDGVQSFNGMLQMQIVPLLAEQWLISVFCANVKVSKPALSARDRVFSSLRFGCHSDALSVCTCFCIIRSASCCGLLTQRLFTTTQISQKLRLPTTPSAVLAYVYLISFL